MQSFGNDLPKDNWGYELELEDDVPDQVRAAEQARLELLQKLIKELNPDVDLLLKMPESVQKIAQANPDFTAAYQGAARIFHRALWKLTTLERIAPNCLNYTYIYMSHLLLNPKKIQGRDNPQLEIYREQLRKQTDYKAFRDQFIEIMREEAQFLMEVGKKIKINFNAKDQDKERSASFALVLEWFTSIAVFFTSNKNLSTAIKPYIEIIAKNRTQLNADYREATLNLQNTLRVAIEKALLTPAIIGAIHPIYLTEMAALLLGISVRPLRDAVEEDYRKSNSAQPTQAIQELTQAAQEFKRTIKAISINPDELKLPYFRLEQELIIRLLPLVAKNSEAIARLSQDTATELSDLICPDSLIKEVLTETVLAVLQARDLTEMERKGIKNTIIAGFGTKNIIEALKPKIIEFCLDLNQEILEGNPEKLVHGYTLEEACQNLKSDIIEPSLRLQLNSIPDSSPDGIFPSILLGEVDAPTLKLILTLDQLLAQIRQPLAQLRQENAEKELSWRDKLESKDIDNVRGK